MLPLFLPFLHRHLFLVKIYTQIWYIVFTRNKWLCILLLDFGTVLTVLIFCFSFFHCTLLFDKVFTRVGIYYNAINQRYSLLGHSVSLQGLWDKRYDNPLHALPPWAGTGLLHFLVLLPVSIPGPHVVLQTPLQRIAL